MLLKIATSIVIIQATKARMETMCMHHNLVSSVFLVSNEHSVFFVSSTPWLATYWQACNAIGYTDVIHNWYIACFCSLGYGRFSEVLKRLSQ